MDEFERLEILFPGDRSELLRLMGLFRATIQHKRHLRLLVAGAAPFDELSDIWYDHFINVRELHIEYLDRSSTLDLLMKPIEAFPVDAIPREVAEKVFDRTGGQPFLVQLYGSQLVNWINRKERSSSTIDDVDIVEKKILSEASPYFKHTFDSISEEGRDVLKALALGQSVRIDPPLRRNLRRRLLIDEQEHLAIPVLGAWICDKYGI